MYKYYKNEFFNKRETVTLWPAIKEDYYEEDHLHDFLELVYTISGSVVHTIDGVKYTATPGSLLFISFGQVHSIQVTGKSHYVNLLIKPEFISEHTLDEETFYDIFRFFLTNSNEKINTDIQLVNFKGKEMAEVGNIVNNMLREEKSKEQGYFMALNGYARVLFTKLLRGLQKENTDENCPKAIFYGLLEYIDNNYSEQITLNYLAAKCFYNSTYISREFKKMYGKGLKEYLTEKRITGAAKLLRETKFTVDEIRVNIGFSDKTRFFKEFHNYYHCTPAEYRKNKPEMA